MMTPRERWLAAIQLDPVDRLPFWPKLNGIYPSLQKPPFTEMTTPEVHEWVGSDQHLGVPGVCKSVRKKTSVEVQKDEKSMRTIYHAPAGDLEMLQVWDGHSASWHPLEFPIKTKDDIARFREFIEDEQFELDEEKKAAAEARQKEIGNSGITHCGIGESALMHFVEWMAGVEMAHYFLADSTAEVEALFEAHHQNLLRATEITCEHAPADLIYMVENTSTTLISPAQYRQYCYPHLKAYAEIAAAKNRNMVLHMCGHLKLLLPQLAELPVRAFEAFTSPTVGNTTLADGRAGCPDKCLIGGTNATLWTQPAATIIGTLEKHLDELPHTRGIVVTSAGVMPPLASPETIRAVADWVHNYPVRN